MQFDMQTVMATLNLMWMGMLSIFVVIIVIFIVTQVMLKMTNRKKSTPEKTENR